MPVAQDIDARKQKLTTGSFSFFMAEEIKSFDAENNLKDVERYPVIIILQIFNFNLKN